MLAGAIINMAIKSLILIDLIFVRTTLAQMRGSAGVVRSRVGLMADGGTSLCRNQPNMKACRVNMLIVLRMAARKAVHSLPRSR
ncbi:hypothetical protein SAMN05660971_01740 [Halomonas cupida]|uniref:Uncharacterized protein n=1 Tax=Halomonas cupida TaxID=44933 RepID=A0A1M7EPV3_9GAMM|nr:hypothetical protein SAMN05660971_01740 [Halomonas cupida]